MTWGAHWPRQSQHLLAAALLPPPSNPWPLCHQTMTQNQSASGLTVVLVDICCLSTTLELCVARVRCAAFVRWSRHVGTWQTPPCITVAMCQPHTGQIRYFSHSMLVIETALHFYKMSVPGSVQRNVSHPRKLTSVFCQAKWARNQVWDGGDKWPVLSLSSGSSQSTNCQSQTFHTQTVLRQ